MFNAINPMLNSIECFLSRSELQSFSLFHFNEDLVELLKICFNKVNTLLSNFVIAFNTYFKEEEKIKFRNKFISHALDLHYISF
jgi:hypothetical protein